jgi:O-antigen/teichoic acid export membrane protein
MRYLNEIRVRLDRLLQKPLIKSTLWLLLSRGLRLVLQAAYFVSIARTLGVERYGEFVGITALGAILWSFVGLGTDILMVKNVAKDRGLFAEYWGNALFMIMATGFGFVGLLILISPIFLPASISIWSVALVAIGDLIFGSIVNVSSRAFQAVDRLNISAQLTIFSMFAKVVAALSLGWFFPHPNTFNWVSLYLGSSMVSAVVAASAVHYLLEPPKLALSRIKPELAEGCYYAISTSSYTIYNDIDKTMLARLSTLEATGIYAAAYRLIDVTSIPLASLSGAAYADFFRKGKDGIGAALAFAKPLIAIAFGYSIVAAIGLLVCSSIVPYILGNEYLNVVPALRLLALIPLFKTMQNFGGDILSGSGFQGLRSSVEVAIAVFNIAINLWLIPRYSWQGAAWASLASDGMLMLMLWSLVAVKYRHQKSKLQD